MKKYFFVAAVCLLASCNSSVKPADISLSSGVTTMTETGMNISSQTSSGLLSGVQTTKNALTTNAHKVPSIGTGTHTIQIFADFQCPACQAAHKAIGSVFEEVAKEGKFVVEYRQFPLMQIHQNAMGDALAALCAHEQGKYMMYKDELYSLEETKRGALISDNERSDLAKKLGLDMPKFDECLALKNFEDAIKSDIELGKSLGVSGTPTFILDGKPLQLSSLPGDQKDIPSELKKFLDTYAAQK